MLYNFRVVFRFLSYAVFMLCRSIMTPCLIIYHQVVTTRNLFAPTCCNFHLLLSTFFFLLFPPMQSYTFDSSPQRFAWVTAHTDTLTQAHWHPHTQSQPLMTVPIIKCRGDCRLALFCGIFMGQMACTVLWVLFNSNHLYFLLISSTPVNSKLRQAK